MSWCDGCCPGNCCGCPGPVGMPKGCGTPGCEYCAPMATKGLPDMGNWRTVQIVGSCPPEQVQALHGALEWDDDWDRFHCLCNSRSLAGVGNWADPTINAAGNLAERDYEVGDVAQQLEKLADVAPGLNVKVHCGDDWESDTCIATVVLADGKVTVGPPEVAAVKYDSTRGVQRLMGIVQGVDPR